MKYLDNNCNNYQEPLIFSLLSSIIKDRNRADQVLFFPKQFQSSFIIKSKIDFPISTTIAVSE